MFGDGVPHTGDDSISRGGETLRQESMHRQSSKTMDPLAVLEFVVCRPILAVAGYAVARLQPVEEC